MTKFKDQLDQKMRVVALANLEAMCKRESGMCRRYSVTECSMYRVTVQWSNPDEWGNANPVKAVLPIISQQNKDPLVVLHPIRYIGCTGKNEEAWQDFEPLWESLPLFQTFDGEKVVWETEYEILVEKYPEFKVSSTWDKDGCIQTYHCICVNFTNWREAQDWAVTEIKKKRDEENKKQKT